MTSLQTIYCSGGELTAIRSESLEPSTSDSRVYGCKSIDKDTLRRFLL